MFKLLKTIIFYWKELLNKKKDFQNVIRMLGASLLGNMLAEKGMLRAGYGQGKVMLKAGNGTKKHFWFHLIV